MTDHHPIAIVTGGSRGLGRSTVLALARQGVRTIFTYQARRDAADEVVAAAKEAGAEAVALPLDTGDAASFARFADEVRAALGRMGAERFDYLVNNAGISHHNAIATTTEAELDALYAVHFKGVFLLTQTLLTLIADGGRIVNVSSGLTRFSFPGSAAYASMKTAIETLTRYMAVELASRRITANVVAPGAIATDFSGGMVRDNPAINKQVADNTALGRVGEPDDIGPMIAALLGDANRWVNGQRIEASGGMRL